MNTERHAGEGDVKKEADTGVMRPQAKERHGPPAPTRSRSEANSRFPPRAFEVASPAHTCILASGTVKQYIVGILSHQVCSDWSQ